MDVGKIRGIGVGSRELQPTRRQILLEHVGQTRLEERDLPTRQLVDLGLVDVDSQHVVTKFGHTHCVGRPQVSRSEHVHLHVLRSEEHTSELQSLMRISYAVFCLKKKKKKHSNR